MAVSCTMPEDSSIFRRFLALYVRHVDGTLVHCTGPQSHVVTGSWDQIRLQLANASDINARAFVAISYSESPLRAVALEQLRDGEVFGILLLETFSDENVEHFFASIILRGAQIPGLGPLNSSAVPDAIVDHFDTTLRYIAKDDMWEYVGRDYFRSRVQYYTSRGARLELCLPAFPCKSSNQHKVNGARPDLGEYIALSNLHKFIEGVEKIYPPGAKLWIISDGHVFSDCIGVDDAVVDAYGAQLIAMNEGIACGSDRVGFKSLVDIFALHDLYDGRTVGVVPDLDIPPIEHHIATKVNEEAELCRRVLMLGFESNRLELRRQIEAQNPAIVALYRGFSKFMCEDVASNAYTKHLSKKQRNKLGSRVAFEMLQRNQAYSNLVEVMFPHHIRLSIHAHPNSGPKFGIQMFGAGVRATNVLSPDGEVMSSLDLLHVPTPWHNCVVEIEGHPFIYVTKSKVVHAAVESGEFSGGLVEGANGGYFKLLPRLH